MTAFALLALLTASAAVPAAGARNVARVTPVEKVLELLRQLRGEVEEEGKTEAAQYDKFACFCKEQSDEKQYRIEKSTKRITKLTAKVDELAADIAELDTDIAVLGKSITERKADIEAGQKERDHEHKVYLVDAKDLADAIAAIEGAIDALQESKTDLGDANVDFVQLGTLSRRAVHAIRSRTSSVAAEATARKVEVALARLGVGQEPASYEYHSKDIISTLQGLRLKFTEKQNEFDKSEFKLKVAFDKNDLNLKNLNKAEESDKAEKEKFSEAKTEEKHATEESKTQETKDKAADESFLAELTEDCETKATQFDQRSQSRSGELTAISKALEVLEAGAAPSYGANKELIGLLQKPVVPQDSQPARHVPSFLQLRGESDRTATGAAVALRVTQLLGGAAHRLGSALLTVAAVRVEASQDHFVKVRSIIKDLLGRLSDDADAEANQKSFCDENIANEVSTRDKAQAEIEGIASKVSQLEAENAELTQDVAELSKAIAELKKALAEATELRDAESAENMATLKTAEEGKGAVEMALQVLNDFYKSAGLVQIAYTPPNADREGKTVSDRSPEVFSGEYGGKQEASKGIVGLLEVIQSDFERTITTVTQEEDKAAADHAEFARTTGEDVADKDASKTTKEGRITDNQDQLVDLKTQHKEQEDLLDGAVKALSELKKQCVDGEESYEERVAKRQKEIEALKQAEKILSDWQA